MEQRLSGDINVNMFPDLKIITTQTTIQIITQIIQIITQIIKIPLTIPIQIKLPKLCTGSMIPMDGG